MRMNGAGDLRERVAFDAPHVAEDGYGGTDQGWGLPGDAIQRNAEFIYQRGTEKVQAGHATGTAVFKVRISQSVQARMITTDWRMRATRKGVEYQIREVDNISDRQWIWLIVESRVAG